jgi:AraC-like DNA-binding protein
MLGTTTPATERRDDCGSAAAPPGRCATVETPRGQPMSKRTTSGAWIKGLVETLAGQGLDAEMLLARTGIDPAILTSSTAHCPTDKISALWNLAVEVSGDPYISLAAPNIVRPTTFDVVGYAMMSSPTLRVAPDRLFRYLRIVSDAAAVDVHDHGANCSVGLQLFGADLPVPRQQIEYDPATLLSFCRWTVGRELKPVAAEFSNPQPADRRPYEKVFDCPLEFDADHDRMTFKTSDLAAAPLASHPTVAEMHEQLAIQRLEQPDTSRISHRAREAIIKRLADGEPRREEIAAAMCMSERTLQRRFQEEGLTYPQLLDNTRRELAQQYLGRRNLSLAQVAYLVGLSDQSNFFRASKRWFDLSPGQYRARAEQGRAQAAAAAVAVGSE